jgi:DNA invertase Pin-like site-specific DNA recombinase
MNMTTLTRCYCRASTTSQDATRAREQLELFAKEHGLLVAGVYVENESGAKLARPELFKLISDSKPGDILLIEQVDRLSRLNDADWRKLRAELDAKQIRVVALDLPTSFQFADVKDEFMSRMVHAFNGMLLDMLAAISRKDYDDRRRRAAQGIAKAKAEGRYKGRPENVSRNAGIAAQLRGGASWTSIQKSMGVSRATIAKVARRAAARAAE